MYQLRIFLLCVSNSLMFPKNVIQKPFYKVWLVFTRFKTECDKLVSHWYFLFVFIKMNNVILLFQILSIIVTLEWGGLPLLGRLITAHRAKTHRKWKDLDRRGCQLVPSLTWMAFVRLPINFSSVGKRDRQLSNLQRHHAQKRILKSGVVYIQPIDRSQEIIKEDRQEWPQQRLRILHLVLKMWLML